MTKKYIWDIYIRLSHILMIILMAGLYITSDSDSLLNIHNSLGVSLGVLILFRVIYAFLGSKYAKIRSFHFGIDELKEYMLSVPTTKVKKYTSHNPASSWAIIAIIGLSILAIITGLLAYGVQEHRGVFYFLNNDFFRDMKIFKEIHEFFANTLMFVIFAHILGALIDKFFHKNDSIDSMVNGYKDTNDEEIKKSIFHSIYAIIAIISIIATLIYTNIDNNIFTKNYNTKIEYEKESKLFVNECGSCHFIYPPFMLPQNSWGQMMGNLKEHFGTDASLDSEDEKAILEYLVKYSAENSKREASVYVLDSIKDTNTIAITKTPYWIKKHRDIDTKKSKCTSCHSDIKDGMIEDSNIKDI